MNKLITLTSDFGYKDWFVGAMKGHIHQINPQARIVDVGHDLPSFSIETGVFFVQMIKRFFKEEGNIHVVVIDPGVGSKRDAVAIQVKSGIYIGPNNGVFTSIIRDNEYKAYLLSNQHFFPKEMSRTFHGYDLFAPAAAHLSKGANIEDLGDPISNLEILSGPDKSEREGTITGQIVYSDKFGNLITNIEKSLIGDRTVSEIGVGDYEGVALANFYGQATKGSLMGIWGSHGHLELFSNQANCRKEFDLKIKQQVTLKYST